MATFVVRQPSGGIIHTHTHTQSKWAVSFWNNLFKINKYIYLYIYMLVCICVLVIGTLWMFTFDNSFYACALTRFIYYLLTWLYAQYFLIVELLLIKPFFVFWTLLWLSILFIYNFIKLQQNSFFFCFWFMCFILCMYVWVWVGVFLCGCCIL